MDGESDTIDLAPAIAALRVVSGEPDRLVLASWGETDWRALLGFARLQSGQLEAGLGTRLLHRSGRGVAATERGQIDCGAPG